MIALDRQGPRWTITLNRPDKANALSVAMLEQLDAFFAEAQAAQDLRLLVVTGTGERVFCAGADLGQAKDANEITTNPVWERVSHRLAALPCLTIAALNGTLAGGGFGLALACDLRLAVPGAKFFYPVLKNGFLPQKSDVIRMRALIGPARTKMILLAAQKITADEALVWGLIDRIAPHGDFETTIAALSEAALAANPAPLVAIKRLIDGDLTDAELADCHAAVYTRDPGAIARLRG